MFESEDNIFLNQAPDSLISVEEVLADGGQMHHSVLESAGPVKPALRLLSVLFMVGVFIIAGRVYDLQVAKGSVYRGLAEDNRVRLIQNFAPRGLIVDRYGQVIARNTPSFALAVIPHDLPQDEGAKESLLNLAAQISGANLDEMKEKLAEADNAIVEPISIAENLPQDKALALEDFVAKNPSFQIQNKPIREYIDGPVFAALLGYVGKINNNEWSEYKSRGYSLNDSVGKTGIEVVYENVLHGKNGGTEVEVDAMGKVTKKLRDVEPKPGADVRLTIDAGLQKIIYNSLSAMLAKRPQAFGAAAIAQDAKTGEVLAMVSLPTYDNNLFARGISGTDYKR
ncbi:MAG TPA: hypothetical protein VEA37_03430, partial [Flavobacterium sp.]|nr:hypothetical protein [Flavobacterium sp.]